MTLAALYGAGGGAIGRQVAERLGVQLFDREIPAAAAAEAGVPEEGIEGEEPRGLGERLVDRVARAGTMTANAGWAAGELDMEERRLRGYVEEFMARAAQEGGVVIGRGGMVVLRSVPWALHVYLRGPREARVQQAMKLREVDRQAAEQRQQSEDRARIEYVTRAYGVDGEDSSLYHLSLDSTALGLETCVELIVAASLDRVRQPRTSEPI